MRPIILAAQPSDARKIVRNMRENSIKEIDRVGISPNNRVEIIEKAIKDAQFSWTGWVDGEVACIWGLVTPTLTGEAATLWLISTPLVEEHAFTFVRNSQIFIREVLSQRFKIIHGQVDCSFSRSIRWLKWLGFKVDMPKDGFHYFHMSRG